MKGSGGYILPCLLAVVLCYAVAVGSLAGLDSVRNGAAGKNEILYLPNEKLLNHFTAGLSTIVADMLWLHCIQYTALEHRGKRHFTWLEHMLTTVTRLDPYFVDAYRFGAIFLAALRADPDASLRLARAGMVLNPHSWQLPYEAAMNYLLNKREDPDSRKFAAHYISMSTATGKAPTGIVNLAAKLQSEFNLLELEQEVWQSMLESKDEFLRELAKRKLAEIQNREVCRILNEQMDAFEQRMQRRATSIEDLIQAGFITHVPEDPLGGQFILAGDGRVYNTTLMEDEILRASDILKNAVYEYELRYGAFPKSLEKLVEAHLLDCVPAHPHPDRKWQYDPQTGAIE